MQKISKNGVHLVITKDDKHKRPILGIMFDGEPDLWKVASFDADDKAKWFYDIINENWMEEYE